MSPARLGRRADRQRFSGKHLRSCSTEQRTAAEVHAAAWGFLLAWHRQSVAPEGPRRGRGRQPKTGPVYFSPGPWPGSSGTTDASRKASCSDFRPSRSGAAW